MMQASLTIPFMAAILDPLSQKTKVGISPPRKATTGHFNQWFFYIHQKVIRDYSVYFSLWWGVLSSPLNGWPGLAGRTNLIHFTAQRLVPMGGGYSSLQGLRHATK